MEPNLSHLFHFLCDEADVHEESWSLPIDNIKTFEKHFLLLSDTTRANNMILFSRAEQKYPNVCRCFLLDWKKLDFDRYFPQISFIHLFCRWRFHLNIKLFHCKRDCNFGIVHTPYLLDLGERLSQFGILILDLESCRLQLLKDDELGRENIICICNISIWLVW